MNSRKWSEEPARVLRVRSVDGEFDAYVARPERPRGAAIVVLHEVFGVNGDMRATCDELASAGFLAVCPELFWRQARGVDLSVSSGSDWQKGLAFYRAYDLDAGVRDIEATLVSAADAAGVTRGVGVLGYCLGGLLAYLTATRTRVEASVAFHGGRTDEFLDEAGDLDAPVQFHLADEDEFITPEAQRRIVDAVAGNPRVEVHRYAGCRHAFSRHGGAHFDPAAARLSRSRTLEFFARNLL